MNPEPPSFEAAVALRQSGRPEEALVVLQALALAPSCPPEVDYQIAWCLDNLDREAEALGHYERALARGLGPQDRPEALVGLGSTYRNVGELAKARALLEAAAQEFPDRAVYRVFLALVLFDQGEFAASTRGLLEVLAGGADASVAAYSRAIGWYAQRLPGGDRWN